jgi:hypothetical protein
MKLIMTKLTMTEIMCAAVLLLFAVYTHAAANPEKQNKAEYDATIARADADFKAANDACNARQGHDKDVCIQQAKTNRDTARADAEAMLKSKNAVADAREDKMDAQIKLAKEKCEALTGDAKNVCLKDAQARSGPTTASSYSTAGTERQNKAEYNATIARADADYKVASEACNSQKGHDKEVCIQQAKANRDTAKADANAALKSKDAVADARDDKLVAQYKVAKEKCEALTGDAKDACVKEAKVRYRQL